MTTAIPREYNVAWDTPSTSSAESMPCGGGDIGLNVWAEGGDILFYVDRSGSFDENNQQLKHGRVRLTLDPNPLTECRRFRQTLRLREGFVEIEAEGPFQSAYLRVWVDVGCPVIRVEISAATPVNVRVAYENWRGGERLLTELERMACYSFAGTTPEQFKVRTHADIVQAAEDAVEWYHHNDNADLLFDKLLSQQHLSHLADQIPNPQRDFTFGGTMSGPGLTFLGTSTGSYASTPFTAWTLSSRRPLVRHSVQITLHAGTYADPADFVRDLRGAAAAAGERSDQAWKETQHFWSEFWQRSAIVIDAPVGSRPWQVARNYQLFRYTLACNANGTHPTKFNGSLFTYDPEGHAYAGFTPDFRAWGGGSATAQNQRLVYFPMLASGDFDLMRPQLDFYRKALPGAEARTREYWGHAGACFTEQMENFGLPCGEIYEKHWGHRGIEPRPGEDRGTLLNAWCSDQYDTVLEFCLMALDLERYAGWEIGEYLPLLDACVTFFDEHYRYQHRLRTGEELDADGKLVIFPGSAAETYKEATNSATTVAGLRVVLTRMLELSEQHADAGTRRRWTQILASVPELTLRPMHGRTTISPAHSWERINNEELPQLYPVFPWGIYGIGRPDLDIAVDTYRYGADNPDQHGVDGWKQDPIFAARLGLVGEAEEMILHKLSDSSRRFPTFWGPNFDWVPDFNHAGSAAIALQEMLLQCDGTRIHLLPAWPPQWDVDFTLRAAYQTTVEVCWRGGELERLVVTPPHRAADIILPSERSSADGS